MWAYLIMLWFYFSAKVTWLLFTTFKNDWFLCNRFRSGQFSIVQKMRRIRCVRCLCIWCAEGIQGSPQLGQHLLTFSCQKDTRIGNEHKRDLGKEMEDINWNTNKHLWGILSSPMYWRRCSQKLLILLIVLIPFLSNSTRSCPACKQWAINFLP